ncbi:PIN domain-like protein [Lentinula lateritia]|nr:PIN domain-like protein [Lentinula lateritia]
MAVGQLHGSNTTLTQFFKLLCGLSKSSAHCIFVFDGNERAQVKRGRRVITNELDYLKQSKTLIKHFGYYCHMAPGEAEAEIIDMLKQGIIDTILSKDSDVFPLGAESVMNLPVFCAIQNLVFCRDKSRYWQELSVRIYSVRAIGFSQAGFLLIALLLRNDLGSGISGIGAQTAFRLAQSGFGNALLDAYKSFSTIPQQLTQACQDLNRDMAHEIEFNKKGKMGISKIFRDSRFPTLEDLDVLGTFLNPVTSSSKGLPVSGSLKLPTLPNISGIVAFSTEHFAWSPKLMLEHFHHDLWPGVIIRMLSSVRISAQRNNT